MALSYVPNQVFIVLDDVGPEQMEFLDPRNFYSGAYPYANLRWIKRLFSRGVAFPNFYTSDICSPARAQWLSGQYPFRTGIGDIVRQPDATRNYAPAIGTLSLPSILLANGVPRVDCIGKWHLGNTNNSAGGDYLTTPNDAGFGHYAGCLFNVDTDPSPTSASYYNWYLTVNGVQTTETTFNVTELADQFLARNSGPAVVEPFFVYFPQNTAHGPTDWPPGSLHSFGSTPTDGDTAPYHFNTRLRAHLESFDAELGRIFQNMDPEVLARTMFYIVGDNGTRDLEMTPVAGEPGSPDTTPYDPATFKQTPYEGGQRTFLLVSGPLVEQPGRICDHYVDAVDLYSTILHVAGVTTDQRDAWLAANHPGPSHTIDGVSIMPHIVNPNSTPTRSFSLSMSFGPNREPVAGSAWGDSDATTFLRVGYRSQSSKAKLVRWDHLGRDECYDLESDPLETTDLGTSNAEYLALREAYEALLRTP